MNASPEFDLQSAHRLFSTNCFNKTWDLIDLAERSEDENEQMIHLSLTSLWHWTQREDCTDKNLSIAYWQASRVFALVGQAENAMHYGKKCLAYSLAENIPPFYLGYAYEALARGSSLNGDLKQRDFFLGKAKEAAEHVVDPNAKEMLLDDLKTIP
jgi:hypothetical protein